MGEDGDELAGGGVCAVVFVGAVGSGAALEEGAFSEG